MSKINDSGFATFMIITLIMMMSLTLLLGLISVKTLNLSAAGSIKDGAASRDMVRSCEEAALSSIKSDAAYTGTQSLTLGSYQCSYDVQNGTGPVLKTITSTSNIGSSTSRSVIEISELSGQIQIRSYSEQ